MEHRTVKKKKWNTKTNTHRERTQQLKNNNMIKKIKTNKQQQFSKDWHLKLNASSTLRDGRAFPFQ